MRAPEVRRRKKHKHKIPQDLRDWLRYQLIQRDGENVNCHWCQKHLLIGDEDYDSPDYATIEHLVRIADGGTDDLSNLAWACKRCNSTRHTE